MWCAAGPLVVAVVGVVVGLSLFPHGAVTLLSGTPDTLSAGIARLLLAVAYTALMMLVVATIGLFISTLTEVPIAAMAGTLAVAIVSEVLVAVPQLHALAPWLFSHYWLSLGDFLRDPIRYDQVQKGPLLALGYIVVFGLAGLGPFRPTRTSRADRFAPARRVTAGSPRPRRTDARGRLRDPRRYSSFARRWRSRSHAWSSCDLEVLQPFAIGAGQAVPEVRRPQLLLFGDQLVDVRQDGLVAASLMHAIVLGDDLGAGRVSRASAVGRGRVSTAARMYEISRRLDRNGDGVSLVALATVRWRRLISSTLGP